jgi:alpha-methylacyl-CoA racemase
VTNTGPLAGVKVIELGGIGPGPHAAMVLADLGADVVRVRRPNQLDNAAFPTVHKPFADRFASKTRDEWTEIFAGTDACVTPVLTWTEASQNDHLLARATVVEANGVEQAAPAPRFSRAPSGPVGGPPQVTTPIDEIDW